MWEWFKIDLNNDNGIIRQVIDRDAKKCYKDWKSDLHNYFKKWGGKENEVFIRQNPPKSVKNKEYWGPTVDRFLSPEFQVTNKIFY